MRDFKQPHVIFTLPRGERLCFTVQKDVPAFFSFRLNAKKLLLKHPDGVIALGGDAFSTTKTPILLNAQREASTFGSITGRHAKVLAKCKNQYRQGVAPIKWGTNRRLSAS